MMGWNGVFARNYVVQQHGGKRNPSVWCNFMLNNEENQ